jgi:beta propeller repeat protein
MYDITARKVTQVTNSGNAIDPAIYGKWIVYTLNRPHSLGIGDIYVYEISTIKKTRITTSTNASDPSIYGDKIVYADNRNSEFPDVRDIYLYELKIKN